LYFEKSFLSDLFAFDLPRAFFTLKCMYRF